MILRSTKKFLQKTIESVKSFLSGPDYQKLPKDTTSPFDAYAHGNYVNSYAQASYGELDQFYADFSNRWDSEKPKKKKKKKKGKKKAGSGLDMKRQEDPASNNDMIRHQVEMMLREDAHEYPKGGDTDSRLVARRDNMDCDSKIGREKRSHSIAKKLKELEMIDVSNIEHVLDIEEVLHFYSLLTCPVYIDIVEKFFMEMYTEVYGTNALDSSRTSRSGQWRVRKQDT